MRSPLGLRALLSPFMRRPRRVSASSAGPNVLAAKVVAGCNGTQPTLTVLLNSTTYGFYKGSLYYHFDPPSPGSKPGTAGNPVVLKIPSSFAVNSEHRVQISTSSQPVGGSSSPEYDFLVPSCAEAAKGMTWRRLATHPLTGTLRVGCGKECDPYRGDTLCSQPLPLLCIKKEGPGFPLPAPAKVNTASRYNRWSGGVVATTSAVVPPSTLTAANGKCVQELGSGWRVAEFHDGWGWSFQAFGGVGDPTQRFWVHINNKPDGNCWSP